MSQATNNAETPTRTEKEGLNIDPDPGRGRNVGSTSQDAGSQQERTYRTHSSESSIFSSGTSVTGGMLDHLIDDHLDQMAAKEDEVKRIQAEMERLKARVQELKALREDLKKKESEQNE